ncbi:hypothetical protein F2Q69_00005289 [Brassica cretica]|uniref:C2 domain-containing protein n=1 Tax=Brassica cretica TaxID=69181 RepID=A0A8S9PGV9_BRACR|nr:hypothetical protein F2Q69_00005289 [Brassica cretica]
METEMEFSDVVQTSAKYKRNGLCGNSSIGSENGIERNMKSCLVTSLSVTGEQNLIATVTVSLGYQEEEESLLRVIKPGMKLFLYDFEKRLLYEATIGGKLEDIQPQAFGQEISCLSRGSWPGTTDWHAASQAYSSTADRNADLGKLVRGERKLVQLTGKEGKSDIRGKVSSSFAIINGEKSSSNLPRFRVYDVDTQYQNSKEEMLKLDQQQFLGEATCVLSEIITKSTKTITLELKRKEGVAAQTQHHHGKLIIHAEESLASKITTEIVFRCSSLESKDLFSKSDPFLVVSKIVEQGTPIPVSKTEVLKNNLNPIWKPLFLSVQQVGSKDSPLIIECSDFNSNGKHSLIGKVQKSLSDLEKLQLTGQGINLSLPTTGAGQSKVLKSQLFVDKFTETVQHTFLEYLASGFELSFMVAIDFTASNGNPRLPDSLHYIDPSGHLNAYQRAIVDVGEVLQFYDSDKRFPAWGFGARPFDSPVSHCFNLNGSSSYSEVDGIQGIMTSYTSALFNVSLAGPTLFGPVINSAAMIASQSLAQGSRRYYVLLIITDGVITDLQETKDALVSASDLPLSILIVGVGGADFKEMEILDADRGERLESSSGRVASRDIVQFVALRDVQHGEVSVVQALLAELPSQFLTYMRIRNMKPVPL